MQREIASNIKKIRELGKSDIVKKPNDKLYQEGMFGEATPQRKTTDELYTPPDAEGAKSRKSQELDKLKGVKRNYDLAIEDTKDSNELIKLKKERGKITRKISEIEDALGKATCLTKIAKTRRVCSSKQKIAPKYSPQAEKCLA